MSKEEKEKVGLNILLEALLKEVIEINPSLGVIITAVDLGTADETGCDVTNVSNLDIITAKQLTEMNLSNLIDRTKEQDDNVTIH